jgi:hypothetical protein
VLVYGKAMGLQRGFVQRLQLSHIVPCGDDEGLNAGEAERFESLEDQHRLVGRSAGWLS